MPFLVVTAFETPGRIIKTWLESRQPTPKKMPKEPETGNAGIIEKNWQEVEL